MLPVKSELEARGEGGQLVHGRATLRPPANRADLFSPDLDLKLSSVQCSLCREESASLGDWREHCSTQHPAHPGFSPSTLHCGLPSHPALFSASLQRPFACPACSRCENCFKMLQNYFASKRKIKFLYICIHNTCIGQPSPMLGLAFIPPPVLAQFPAECCSCV